MARVLLITGRPGSGKTTVIRKVAASVMDRHLAGFYTEEIRGRTGRQGFRAISFDGATRVISHVRFAGPQRVGKYGVDVEAMDDVARRALRATGSVDLCLVDEIGKMECLSSAFVDGMRALFQSRIPVVATIAQRGGGFIDQVKQRRDAVVWTVARANRDALPDQILAWIAENGGRARKKGR